MDDEQRKEVKELLNKYKNLPTKERIRVIVDTEELLERQENGEASKKEKEKV